jgi:hypothetical protein
LQISVCGLACAICKCVQCALASLTVPKGRSGSAKTKFSLSVSLYILCLFSCFNQFYLLVQFLFSALQVTVWRYVFVADLEALPCQVTRKFIRCRNTETRTISAIKHTACYQLGVLPLCQWFEIIFYFSHSGFSD